MRVDLDDSEILKPTFVVISGLIGAGKTTFMRMLCALLGFGQIEEPTKDNPYLSDFYRDPGKWAYPMQEYLKHRRFASYQDGYWGIRTGRLRGVVLDRSILEDPVFAMVNRDLGTIDPRNYETYLRGFEDFCVYLPTPDLYVYLDVSPETCVARTRQRVLDGMREAERETAFAQEGEKNLGVPLSYMRELHRGYEMWLERLSVKVPVIRVPWEKFRPIEEVWEEILDELSDRHQAVRSLSQAGPFMRTVGSLPGHDPE